MAEVFKVDKGDDALRRGIEEGYEIARACERWAKRQFDRLNMILDPWCDCCIYKDLEGAEKMTECMECMNEVARRYFNGENDPMPPHWTTPCNKFKKK